MMKEIITLNVNGQDYEVTSEARSTLLEVLRDKIGLTGTKKGCDDGSCGACTVLLEGEPALACLTLAVRVVGRRIMTVEELAKDGSLHPLQEAFADCGAVQCGFCTPGMLMSAKALLDRNPNPSEEEIKHALSGNLCRCTGYAKIIEAVTYAAHQGASLYSRTP